MRTIFQLSENCNSNDAKNDLAMWLYKYSDAFDYDSAHIEDALTTAKEFLAENQQRRVIET